MTGSEARAAVRAAGPLPDDEIARRVVAGEIDLFEVLMRRHNPRVYRAIRGILRSEAEVEDAMQQAYLHAYAHLGEFRGDSTFSTWLLRIAVNEGLGRLRGRDRLVLLDDLSAPPEEEASGRESPEDRAAAREAMGMLEKAIDRLPLALRTVYLLREVDGLSTGDAADVLGISPEAVKVRLHRARLALRDLVAAEVGQGAAGAFPFLAPRCDRVVAAVLAEIGAGPRRAS